MAEHQHRRVAKEHKHRHGKTGKHRKEIDHASDDHRDHQIEQVEKKHTCAVKIHAVQHENCQNHRAYQGKHRALAEIQPEGAKKLPENVAVMVAKHFGAGVVGSRGSGAQRYQGQ